MNAINNQILQKYQAATEHMADDQIVQYGADNALGNGVHTAGAVARAFRLTKASQDAIAENNRVRQDLLDAVRACYGDRPFAQLPESVRAAFRGTHAFSDAGDMGLKANDQVTSGKPLTARRIRAVLSAVQADKLKESLVKSRDDLRNVTFMHLQQGCDRFPVVRRSSGTILAGFCKNLVNKLTDLDFVRLPAEVKKEKLQGLARSFVGFSDAFLYTLKDDSAENVRYRETHPGVTQKQMETDCKKGILTQFFFVLEELNRNETTRVCDEETVQAVKAQMQTDFGYDDDFANGIVWNE